MITHISERETQLSAMLRTCTEALRSTTEQRNDLVVRVEELRASRDEYQRAADKLAANCKVLRDALENVKENDCQYCAGSAYARAALVQAVSELVEPAQSLTEDQTDAARYRWLRKHNAKTILGALWCYHATDSGEADLDTVLSDLIVDSAMKGKS